MVGSKYCENELLKLRVNGESDKIASKLTRRLICVFVEDLSWVVPTLTNGDSDSTVQCSKFNLLALSIISFSGDSVQLCVFGCQ